MGSESFRLLLDTHVWVWLLNGDEGKIAPPVLNKIFRAGENGQLHVSVISVWEIAMLEAKGRLVLAKGCWNWVAEALSLPGLSLVPLTPEIAVESTRLPGEFHKDPADSILVATARNSGGFLATKDARIIEYGKKGHVHILEA